MLERHWHWEFVAYNGEPEPREVHFAVDVIVIGYLSEADARVAARDIVQRDHYALKRVWECASCGFYQASADAMHQLAKAVE